MADGQRPTPTRKGVAPAGSAQGPRLSGSADPTGKALGQAGQILGSAVSQLGNVLAKRAETIRAQDLSNERASRNIVLMEESRLLNDSMLSRQSGAALGSTMEAESVYDTELYGKHIDGVQDPELIAALTNDFHQVRNASLNRISGHERDQRKVNNREILQTYSGQKQRWAEDNFNGRDFSVIDSAVRDIRNHAADVYFADWDPGVDGKKDAEVFAKTQALTGEAVSKMITGAYDQLLQTDPATAVKSFNQFEEQIKGLVSGAEFARLKEKVDTVDLRNESQFQTALIRSEHPEDFRAQLDAARDIDDAEVQDKTVRRLKESKAEDDRISKENQLRKNDAATRELQSGRDSGMTKLQLYDMAAESLGGEGDAAARNKAENLIDSWFKPEPVDWAAVIEVQNLIDASAAEGEPLTNEFLTLNYGGLVGRKLPSLLARNTSAVKNLAKASFVRANENLLNLFQSREFGNPARSKAKSRYNGIDTELNQFIEANPQGDPVEWLDARIKTYRQEKLAGDINSWSDKLASFNPLRESSVEAFEKITDEGLVTEMLGGETDEGLATRLAVDFGVSPEDLDPGLIERIKTSDEYIAARAESLVLTEKQIKRAMASKEFQDFKLRKLQELEKINL